MCNREPDVLDAVASGRWDDLREHLSGCQDCADLALVAGFMREEGEQAMAEVHVPSASFLWWKSKLRARREAQEKVLRPVLIAEKVAVGAGLAGGGLLAWWLLPSAAFVMNSTFALATAAALLSLAGFAAYAVFAKE